MRIVATSAREDVYKRQAGEAVQVYISRPDPTGAQPVWLLDCFARTKLLAPGERETVQLRFPVTELAAYRESACAFALEEGYYLSLIHISSAKNVT